MCFDAVGTNDIRSVKSLHQKEDFWETWPKTRGNHGKFAVKQKTESSSKMWSLK